MAYWFQLILSLIIILATVIESSPAYCTSNSGPSCFGFCSCSVAADNSTIIYCDSDTFPEFSYDLSPVSAVGFYGSFNVLYDNAFYLLMNLTNATVCFSTYLYHPSTLTTYENTFLTYGKNGIVSLYFNYVNPINISTMSNSADIIQLTITGNEMATAPDLTRFSSLVSLDLSDNGLTTLTWTFPKVVSLDLSDNRLTTLQAANFNFTSLTGIDASFNKITTVDPLFSKWLSSSMGNSLTLTTNGPWQCDSALQWMATYIICPPQQIIIDNQTAKCQSGEPLVNFLVPFARCTH